MRTGLHAVGWGLQRLALALGIAALGIMLAYSALVLVLVAGQAISSWGQ
jgi:hypothetical protein